MKVIQGQTAEMEGVGEIKLVLGRGAGDGGRSAKETLFGLLDMKFSDRLQSLHV